MFNKDIEIATALKADGTVTSLVGTRISNGTNWDGGQYPAVTFAEVGNNPALHCDDAENEVELVIQVTIHYQSGDCLALANAVEKVMLGLGFMRRPGNNFEDGKTRLKIMRFVITGKGD